MAAASGVVAQDVPRRSVDAVEWPAEGAAAPIPDGPFSKVNDSFLPVLVPDAFFNFKTLAFVGEPLSYTASVVGRGFRLSITGSRVSYSVPTLATPSANGITGSLGEQAAFASFGRYGAGYMVSVECDSAADRRCASEDYVRSLARAVQFVGGSKEAPPADMGDVGAGAPLPPAASADPAFTFRPAGELQTGSGSGVRMATIFAPGIRFPVEHVKAYLNSQVWGIGGFSGPRGSWRDPRNYAYPWRDNFCESRSRKTPACPSGAGHQGVDIRGNDHQDQTYWAVATEDGRISNVGSYSVTLMADSGIQYRYLHLKMKRLAIKQGTRITRGQKIGLISNDFGGTSTTVHLHFEMLMNQRGAGFRHVPPYTSLVAAYQSFR